MPKHGMAVLPTKNPSVSDSGSCVDFATLFFFLDDTERVREDEHFLLNALDPNVSYK